MHLKETKPKGEADTDGNNAYLRGNTGWITERLYPGGADRDRTAVIVRIGAVLRGKAVMKVFIIIITFVRTDVPKDEGTNRVIR